MSKKFTTLTTKQVYLALRGVGPIKRAEILKNWPDVIVTVDHYILSSIFSALLDPCTINSFKRAEALLQEFPLELQFSVNGEDWWIHVLSHSSYATRYFLPTHSQQVDRLLSILKKCHKSQPTRQIFADVLSLPDYYTLDLISDWARRLNGVDELPIPSPQHFVALFLYARFKRIQTNHSNKTDVEQYNSFFNDKTLLKSLKTLDNYGQDWAPFFRLVEHSDAFKQIIYTHPFFAKKLLLTLAPNTTTAPLAL